MACNAILRFARMYYNEHKDQYTAQQQTALEALFVAADAVDTAIAPVFVPLP